MMRIKRSLARALLVVGAPLAAQDELARENAVGVVRGLPEGKTAVVELLSRPWAAEPRFGDVDRVRAETDPRGRFKAALLPGREYCGWAYVDLGEAGVLATATVDGLVARGIVALEISADRPQKLRTIRVDSEGDGAADLRIRLVVSRMREGMGSNFIRTSGSAARLAVQFDQEPTALGQFLVPPLPAGSVKCYVLTKAGAPVGEFSVGQSDLAQTEKTLSPKPLEVRRLIVRDIDTGKGVAGATVFSLAPWGEAGLVAPMGTTDADGCAEVLTTADMRFFARDPGHAPAGFQRAKDAGGEPDWKPLRDGFEPDFAAHVGPGIALKGRLRVGDRAAGDCTLILSEGAMHYQQKNSRSIEWTQRALVLDADGAFTAPGVLSEFPPDVIVLLGRETIAGFPPAWRSVWPVVPTPVMVDSSAKTDVDFGDIDLSLLVPVHFTIQTPDGAPALGARVDFLPPRSTFARTDLPAVPLDRSGECTVLLPRGRRFGVWIQSDSGSVLGSLITGDPKGDTPIPIVIRTKALVAIEGRVCDPNRNPMSGVMLTVSATMSRGSRVVTRDQPNVPEVEGGAQFTPSLRPEQLEFISMSGSPLGSSGRTEADGRFRILVPDVQVDWTIMSGRTRVTIAAEDWPPKPLEIEMPSK